MKNIRPKEIIKMKQFIREPVDSITEEISENSSKRIILNGGRGTGKSVILNNMEDKGIGTENQTILMQFDSIISFSTTSPNEYFDLFDKTIITTDDVLLENRNRQKELEKKGYSFITPVYGKKLNVVKQIIRERIRLYNKQLDNSVMPFDENVMTNKIYKSLINKSNGNIQLMLDTLSDIIELLESEQIKVENLEAEFDNEANERLSYLKKLERMDGTPPRLHL